MAYPVELRGVGGASVPVQPQGGEPSLKQRIISFAGNVLEKCGRCIRNAQDSIKTSVRSVGPGLVRVLEPNEGSRVMLSGLKWGIFQVGKLWAIHEVNSLVKSEHTVSRLIQRIDGDREEQVADDYLWQGTRLEINLLFLMTIVPPGEEEGFRRVDGDYQELKRRVLDPLHLAYRDAMRRRRLGP